MWKREDIVRSVSEIKLIGGDWMSQEREIWERGAVVKAMMNLRFT
jgi:hypothetical protein